AGSAVATTRQDARLAALDEAAERILLASRPANTARAFEGDWQLWERFCAEQGFEPATVSAGLFIAFVTWLANPTEGSAARAPASIERHLAGVLDGLRRRKCDTPRGITSGARKVIDRYRRQLVRDGHPTGRGPATALTIPNMRRLSQALPDTIVGVRDRAIVLLGFAIAGRRSEVAALHVSDITRHPQGVRVAVRDSKTGQRAAVVRPGSNTYTCPVTAWEAWTTAAGIADGPAFRRIDRFGKVQTGGLSGHSIGRIVTRAGESVDLAITGHSLRSGLATEARRAGHDAKTIANQGGWLPNSTVLYGYMQTVDEWAESATEGLGL
ncbi:MAG: tyrosine-type recombinase/integrase, partial [Acidimicrobiales bacterium]